MSSKSLVLLIVRSSCDVNTALQSTRDECRTFFVGPLVGPVLMGGPAGESDARSMAGRSRRCLEAICGTQRYR